MLARKPGSVPLSLLPLKSSLVLRHEMLEITEGKVPLSELLLSVL